MWKIIITACLLLLSANLYAQETDVEDMAVIEEVTTLPMTKLEKAESELAHMQEKVDFYKRVVRSVEREEEELKQLKKLRIRNVK